ncbi:MAG: cupin domain-containing protein [Chloroflexi bacterium]|jgi:quercetin dioxygenase-like cupin family protein|nr:cupin domain-containing protein [Chloroflexota bacterium]
MSVKHIRELELKPVQAGSGTSMQVLISAEDGPNFAMRRFIMQPGGGMPRHTNLVEHEQFVLSGHARIGIGDEVYEVSTGNVVFIPAEVPHWYNNIGAEPFEFLCLVPNQLDEIKILE